MISMESCPEWFALIEHIILTVFLISVVTVFVTEGWPGTARVTLVFLKTLPGFQQAIDLFVKREVNDFVKLLREEGGKSKKDLEKIPPRVTLPEKGISADTLREEMKIINKDRIKTDAGKIFALVYTLDGDNFQLQQDAYDMFTQKSGVSVKHDALVKEFHHAFMHENALNPMMFPSLRRFETEIVTMCADMLNGDENVVGSLTSGGTESILMAVKTYRDRARKLYPHIVNPEMVAPITIHPAFEKAAHYFNMPIVHVPIDDDFRVNVLEYKKAITKNTVALLASATQYCHGVVDPIEEIAAIATETGLPFHVDACFGGFMLPWVEKLGYPVPKFDFRLDGVTSMSADLHKYGYTSKGASVVLYRNAEIRKYQIFAYGGWPGGLFGSPTMAGTRPGGNIAASWASLRHLGKDGYLKMAEALMKITKKLTNGINKIPGLKILGNPPMTCFAFAASDPSLDLLAVADVMETKGWKMERQQFPTSIHCTILPQHLPIADKLLADLAESTKKVKSGEFKSPPNASSMYGMLAKIPDKAIVNDVIVEFFSEIYKQ